MKPRRTLFSVMVLLMAVSFSMATICPPPTLDLTISGSSGEINGAVFMQQSVVPGEELTTYLTIGEYDPTRVYERGYNTGGTVEYDTIPGPGNTTAVDVQFVNQVTYNFQLYREFYLNVNEVVGQECISLDKLKISFKSEGDLTGYATIFDSPAYDLDAGGDNWIKLYDHAAVGNMDMRFLIPEELFPASGYMYMYAKFGAQACSCCGADDCFEQFRYHKLDDPIPEPASILLFGLAGLILKKKL